MSDVRGRFPAGALVSGGTPRPAGTYGALLTEIDQLGTPVVTADTGVRRVVIVTADDSLVLTILAPPAACESLAASAGGGDNHNCSIGLRLQRPRLTMLFPGDPRDDAPGWRTLSQPGLPT